LGRVFGGSELESLIAEGLAHQVCHRTVITAPEAFPVCFALFRWQVRMPVFVAIVYVGTAMVLEVAAGALHTVVESLPLELVKLVGKSIPLGRRRWWRWRGYGSAVPLISATHQVFHCPVIAPTESVAIGVAHLPWDMGVPIFVAILHVGSTVVIEIAASAFDAVVKSLTLKFIEFLRRNVPPISGGRSFLRNCNLGHGPGR
jgi:ABC-type cobalamin transport system permease subunit